MTPAIVPAKWALDDYHRRINAGILSNRRVELLAGEIKVNDGSIILTK